MEGYVTDCHRVKFIVNMIPAKPARKAKHPTRGPPPSTARQSRNIPNSRFDLTPPPTQI